MWNCTLTTVHQGISQRGWGLGYNRYISTLSDVPLAFLLIYGLLRNRRRRRRRRASARKFFWRFSATSHSLTHLLTHSLASAVAWSFVLFSAVVTKASKFVANFKQIFRFALSLSLCSLSPSLCYCSVSYVRKVRFNLLKFLLFNFIKSTGQNKSECRTKNHNANIQNGRGWTEKINIVVGGLCVCVSAGRI